MSSADQSAPTWAPEVYEVHCPEGVDFAIAALRRAQPPYEVVIAPITERASLGQCRLWAIWMDVLAREMGDSRGVTERLFLDMHGYTHQYEFAGEIRVRPCLFSELTRSAATSVMAATEVAAADMEIELPQGRRTG